MYGEVTTVVDSDTDELSQVENNIKHIPFPSIWNGNVSNVLNDTLENVLTKVEEQKTNLQNFTSGLRQMDVYVAKKRTLSLLQSELASLPDGKVYDGRRSSLSAQIAELQKELAAIKQKVSELFGSFKIIKPITSKVLGLFSAEDSGPKKGAKWESGYLTAGAGSIKYRGSDGRITKETWCDLNPNNLARLMRKQGIDLDFWIREDGVYMYGDYVMVAADIPHMDGTQQDAEYRKGDLVETSLGTGMVVDLCGMAEMVRKGQFRGGQFGDIDVWYDIYTAWHQPGQFHHVGYCNDPDCASTHPTSGVMISPGGNNDLKIS